MNAARRKEIDKALAMIEEAKGILESAASDERDYYDNMPENMQGGDKGHAAEAAADALDEAVSRLEEAVGSCYTAMNG